MPFKSEKQRRFLWLKHPEIARRWTNKYGSEPEDEKKKKKKEQEKEASMNSKAILSECLCKSALARWRTDEVLPKLYSLTNPIDEPVTLSRAAMIHGVRRAIDPSTSKHGAIGPSFLRGATPIHSANRYLSENNTPSTILPSSRALYRVHAAPDPYASQALQVGSHASPVPAITRTFQTNDRFNFRTAFRPSTGTSYGKDWGVEYGETPYSLSDLRAERAALLKNRKIPSGINNYRFYEARVTPDKNPVLGTRIHDKKTGTWYKPHKDFVKNVTRPITAAPNTSPTEVYHYNNRGAVNKLRNAKQLLTQDVVGNRVYKRSPMYPASPAVSRAVAATGKTTRNLGHSLGEVTGVKPAYHAARALPHQLRYGTRLAAGQAKDMLKQSLPYATAAGTAAKAALPAAVVAAKIALPAAVGYGAGTLLNHSGRRNPLMRGQSYSDWWGDKLSPMFDRFVNRRRRPL